MLVFLSAEWDFRHLLFSFKNMEKKTKIILIGSAVAGVVLVTTAIVLALKLKNDKKKSTQILLKNNEKMPPQEFISTFKNAFIEACKGTPLFPSVKLAQAALETGWGKNTVNGANNMFGIKAGSVTSTPYWKGDKILATTKENYGKGLVTINDYFRKYDKLEDSIKDHSYLLMSLNRYASVRNATTPEEQARQLKACGYATDTDYPQNLFP